MKKIILMVALMAALTYGCSSDDDKKEPACDITISGIGYNFQTQTYDITYGATPATQEGHIISETTYHFYQERLNAGNYCWEGDQ